MAISIEIQGKGFLNLSDDVKIPITLSVSDIGDIGRRQGARSTTFKIPRTNHNEELLDFVSVLTYDSDSRNKKIKCNLWENATLIKKGFLSITGIDDSISAVFFGDNVDWFQLIDGKQLNDILFPSEYDHIWNETNVIEGAGRSEGYFYHLHSPNFDQRDGNNITGKLDQSRPATFVHSIFKYIFENINVKITGDLLSDSFFKKIVIPFNKTRYALTSRSAKAKKGTVYLYAGSKTSTFSPDPTNVTYMKMDWGDSTNPDGSKNKYNNTIWDNVNKKYIVPFTDTYTVSCEIQVDLGAHSAYDLYYDARVNGSSVLKIDRIPVDNFPYGIGNCTYHSKPSYTTKKYFFDIELTQGDELEILVGHSYDNAYPDRTTTCTNDGVTNTGTLPRCQVDTDFLASILEITPSRGDYEGGTEGAEYKIGNGIDLASTLPEMTQKDFISYVFNLFGVVPEYDIFSNTLILNKFERIRFNKKDAEDWTDKIDYIKTPKMNFRSIKGYAKKTYFKYSQNDNIASLKSYNVNNGKPYGSGFIAIDNDFLAEEKTVYTAPFSASTVDVDYGNITINLDDEIPIAFISSGQRNSIQINGTDFAAFDLRFDTTQPMPDDAYGASSLSFGMPEGVTSKDTSILKKYYDFKSLILNKPVLVKAYVKLNEVDIINLDFNKPKILSVDGVSFYFLLNKINQYKGDGSSTECELLLML